MINIGFYIDNIGNQKQIQSIAEFVNKSVLSSDIEDISIFYDDIGYNPLDVKCGFFNSTDLWHFTGILITTSIETTKNALNIINNIEILYLYDKEEPVDIFELIAISHNDKIKIISTTQDSAKNIYRLTNKTVYGISDLNNIVNILGV